MTNPLISLVDKLSDDVDKFTFTEPVTHTYNPLNYARTAVHEYLDKCGKGPKKVLFLGMNPGPFGMAQTGVPFGEIAAVRDWIGIEKEIGKPENEHPDRPIQGFDCQRSEVSGKRIWAMFKDHFGTADNFFKDHFVWNYCPLLWSECHQNSGRKVSRNLTPDKLKASEVKELYQVCDKALLDIVKLLEPKFLVGVGAFAEKRLKVACGRLGIPVHRILHPSPASPLANRDFAGVAYKQLLEAGVWPCI
ncbi:MAG: single-stranded DNA-binding protein [Lentisphaeraceae bacterium]|nr:single-stranded DNA-binding protein [Lentisphaeraceae bacterium]